MTGRTDDDDVGPREALMGGLIELRKSCRDLEGAEVDRRQRRQQPEV